MKKVNKIVAKDNSFNIGQSDVKVTVEFIKNEVTTSIPTVAEETKVEKLVFKTLKKYKIYY